MFSVRPRCLREVTILATGPRLVQTRMVQSKQSMMKRLTSITRRPGLESGGWRENTYSLLRTDPQRAEIKMGWPVFHQTYDIIQSRPTSFRKYRPPVRPPTRARRDSEYYDVEAGEDPPFHELIGKFRFEASGHFYGNAEAAEKEIFTTAFNLHLVGWLKARQTTLSGHLQGDTFALSFFQRWLEEKHLSETSGHVDHVRIFEANTGLDQPLVYRHLQCVKDRRKYGKKKIHLKTAIETMQVERFVRESAQKRQDEERFLDEHAVRDY
eukprot:gnl/TRDRNA2_/TRDRNA2_188334_c0_seq1.p1 gnl/TRDRNA2_/TRDRNA2_188334_c0~~gnl/TRDRNA2_/TRDRNA2_188334_c0_seq1.p1  ORF type:complete len:268 (+),score=52.62 gnl/TRDRNA2_/TRDRNA2_188334_c0_seq1:107-910(+)